MESCTYFLFQFSISRSFLLHEVERNFPKISSYTCTILEMSRNIYRCFKFFIICWLFGFYSEPNCLWLTYNPSNSYCQLFSDCSTLDSEFCQDCITSQSACVPGPPACWLQGECSGIVEHTEPALTSSDCLQICNSTIGCRWWTFDSTVNECVLFKSCPKVDESCRDCVSGERRCIDDVTTTTTPSSSSTPVPPKGKLLFYLIFNS